MEIQQILQKLDIFGQFEFLCDMNFRQFEFF